MIKRRFLALLTAILITLSVVTVTVSAEEEVKVISATVVQELTTSTCFEGAEEDTADLSGLRILYELSDGRYDVWGFDRNTYPDLGNNEVDWDFVRNDKGEVVKENNKVAIQITCGETLVEVEYTIIENPVESFELDMDPIVLYEDYSNGVWESEVGVGDYYYICDFDMDDTITVHYKNGTSTTDEAMFFYDDYGWGVELFSTQDVNPWKVGKENYLYAKYMGYTVEIPVEVVPVPVKNIEITKLPDKTEYEDVYKPLWQGMEFNINLKDGTSVSATVADEELEYIRYPLDDYVLDLNGLEVTIRDWGGEYSLICYDVEEVIEGLTFKEHKAVADMTVKQISRTGVGTIVDVTYENGEKETFEFDVQGHDIAVSDRDVSGRIKTDYGYTEYSLEAVYDSKKNLEGYNLYFLDFEAFAPLDVIIPVPGHYLVGDANEDGKINIKDATAIQKHLAKIESLSETGILAAMIIDSDKLSVKDATLIQKYLAGYDVIHPIGETVEK